MGKLYWMWIVALSLAAALSAQTVSSIPDESAEDYAARMQWWREAKFGVFICWGPCALGEQEIGWSRGGPRPGIGPTGGAIPMETYDNFYKRFNPAEFDAREWADVVKASGAQYVIFLTKHHDGFCMFDSALTDYKVTRSPFERDVTAEVADALHEAGIRILWYYSQPDWHHPDFLTENHDRYIEYLHGQIRELCTNYGKIDGIWFDGLYGTASDWDTPRLFEMIHELQPGAIINNRAGVPGDFVTPEQTIGRFQRDRPWESCMTMSTCWSWCGADAPVKSLKECLHMLIRCAGGGGNLALDTGPPPSGRIDPRHEANYRGMGEWLETYGETIYGTVGGPYKPASWGVSTCKGNMVYLHILTWPEGGLLLPPLDRVVLGAKTLTGGEVEVTQSEDTLTVSVPIGDRDDTDTIVALQLDGAAEEIEPISAIARGSLSLGKSATSAGDWSEEYAAAMAFDGDEATRWGGAVDSRSGMLEVDLGAPATFDKLLVLEAPFDRVTEFEVQVREGEEWRTIHAGETLGDVVLRFEPVTAQHVRLDILEATDVPTIWEVHLYPPEIEPPEPAP